MAGERLLLVDDEENFRTMLEAALEHHEFVVESASTGREAVEAAASGTPPDLVILDVMLPDLDGYDVLQRLRESGNHAPVLFISALDAPEARVRALEAGGDDFLVKPFSLNELVARARAVLRRTQRTSVAMRCADLVMDDDAHRVTRGGDEIHLSPTEYRLLHYLLTHQGRALSRAQIVEDVWDNSSGAVESTVVETYIAYLRKKVDAGRTPLIHTVRGFGYCLRAGS